MGRKTEIAWCDHTFNPWWGCTNVSPGCDHCYAHSFSKRIGFQIWGKDAPRRFFGDKHWNEPVKWNRQAEAEGKRRRVFCGSMCDVMEEREDLNHSRVRLYNLIDDTPSLDWLLLTKRPQNFRRFLPKTWCERPRPNVWGMTTVESQDYEWRIRALLETPFVIRGLSVEPLISELNLEYFLQCDPIPVTDDLDDAPDGSQIGRFERVGDAWEPILPRPDWIIVGGESGHHARPMNPDWARRIRDECQDRGIAFFMKQMGGVRDKRDVLDSLPIDLQMRDFPTVPILGLLKHSTNHQ